MNALDVYYDNIGRYDVLGLDEEKSLFKRSHGGCELSRQTIIKHNLKLVPFTLKKFFNIRDYHTRCDAIGMGTQSLVRAVNNYNFTTGKFSTYAVQCIRGGILRWFDIDESYFHYKKNNLKKPDAKVLFKHVVSAEEYVHIGESLTGSPEYETIKNNMPCKPTQGEDYDLNKLVAELNNAMDKLSPREEFVIRSRFLDERTFEWVGRKFDVTRERIRQIESKALRRLRHPNISGDLLKLWEET